VWKPLPNSPQLRAYRSRADELFFGGAAGGGKTDLLLGLALCAHRRSVLFRREYPQLKAVVERLRELLGARGSFNANANTWRLDDGRTLELGAVQHEWDKQKYQGRPHDLVCFDELPHFLQSQFRFLIGWNRTTDRRQPCRVVAAGNPPLSPEGRWVIEEWAPWLDETYPDPAEPGELRWYVMLDGKLHWQRTAAAVLHKGETVTPRSRTFIPARVDDNPHLLATGYKATLQGMPEPLRSQMLYGDFTAGTEDDPYQVIPTAWVRAAMARWRPEGKPVLPLDALGVDVARGGAAKTVLARRYGTWFAPLEKHPGKSTPDGPAVVALIRLALRENPRALVCLDALGVGASPRDFLALAQGEGGIVNLFPVDFGGKTEATDSSGQLHFANTRAQAYWHLRELLDPSGPSQVSLPPDPELLADLTAPRWSLQVRGILIEPKDDIVKRIGRSPDCADAVVNSILIPRRAAAGPRRQVT
jgi:hypothetical protein